VPKETLTKALGYIKRCYDDRSGGFTYQPGSRGPGFARTAAGVCVLQLSGEYDAQQIPKAVAYMKGSAESRQHFYYGHYYAVHAMHTIGGKEWEDWYDRVKTLFLNLQATDGCWSQRMGDSAGPVYQTAIAVIVLSVPCDYLPIFQR
jgi:hypothetical protein